MNVDERTKFILERLGPDAFNVLAYAGIDVNAAVMKILQEQDEKQAGLEALANSGQVSDMMTSELVYKSASPEDVYGQEFIRRPKSIGLADGQVDSLYELESLILTGEELRQQRSEPWARRYFFINEVTTPDNLPKKGLLTLSELIMITDDASSAYIRDHEVLSGKTWGAVCMAAVQTESNGGAQYAFCLKERVQKLGWSPEQEHAFVRNECMLTERLKWGYHENSAWAPETTDLAMYKG